MDFGILVDLAPIVLLFGGVTASSWLLEQLLSRAPVVGHLLALLLKALASLGFLVGVLLLVTAASGLSFQALDSGTIILLTVTGLALFLKPLKDVRWAALFGLIAGGLCVGLVFILHPLPEAILGVSSSWVYLLIFLVPALLAYLLFKFIEDLLKLVASILAFKPVTIILGVACIVQGFLLLFNTSLFTLISS